MAIRTKPVKVSGRGMQPAKSKAGNQSEEDFDLPKAKPAKEKKSRKQEVEPREMEEKAFVIPSVIEPPAAVEPAEEVDEEKEEPSAEDLQKEEQEVEQKLASTDEPSVPRDAEAGIPQKERSSYDGDTAIKLYLREIGLVKLLTPAQEIELAALIKKGDKAARELMIKANLRLVVKIAHDYEGLGLPLLDLINEGNIGLMKAVERFDPAKGGKLSTYGSWWIKQSIKRALANQSKTIRLPVHLVDKISKMRRTAMRLQEEFGREPTDDELGEELGISASRVSQLRTAAIRPASLDAPIGDDDSNNFAEVVQDENADTPYEQLEDKTVTKMLQEMIKTLDPREATILKYRFGLDGGSEKTLEEVGQKFGVTRERVRQIQNIALAKLRKMIEKLEAVQR
ncbi:MAG: sigma-70 family RNA polymerase sigma factor [Verrucomicrobiota bacterium]|nr:sigma-70 family RNA polymerase sigma factor [Verrucomicrobiota bacterium]